MSLEYVSAVMAQGASESDGSGKTWIFIAVIVLLALILPKASKSGKSKGESVTYGTGTLTAEEVVAKRFQPTKFREGYDQDEVDDFLDRTVQELRRLEKERRELQKSDLLRQDVTARVLSPEEVINQRFQPTKFREGYDQDEVDDFLVRITTGLREWASENEQLRRGPSQYGTPMTPS